MINQIRHLQDQRSPEPFAIELASGRVIQIYDARNVATNESGHGSVGILHGDGAFEVFLADKIVSVSVGVHPVEKERMAKAAGTVCATKLNSGSFAPNKRLSMRDPIFNELTQKKQIWIGPQYGTDKRLILGEAAYAGTDVDTLNMQYYIDTGKDRSFGRICRASGNPGTTPAERLAFWSPLMFYNFIRKNLGALNRRPKTREFTDPDNQIYLSAVLSEKQPRAVWIVGTEQAYYSEPIVKAHGIPYVVSKHASRASDADLKKAYAEFLSL